MKFNKNHKTKIETLNELEAGVYLNFLSLERHRHETTVEVCIAWIELWQSELARQQEDLEKIDERVKEVKNKYLVWL